MDYDSFKNIYFKMKEDGIYQMNADILRDFFLYIEKKLEKYHFEEIDNTVEHLINNRQYVDGIGLITSEFENSEIPVIYSSLSFDFIEGKLENVHLDLGIDLISLLGEEESEIMIHIDSKIYGFYDDEFLNLDKEKITQLENNLIDKTLKYLNIKNH